MSATIHRLPGSQGSNPTARVVIEWTEADDTPTCGLCRQDFTLRPGWALFQASGAPICPDCGYRRARRLYDAVNVLRSTTEEGGSF